METLEQRLKKYHIHCLDCGNKVFEFDKNLQEGFMKELNCIECHNPVTVYYKVSIDFRLFTSHTHLVILKCFFNGKEPSK